MANPNIAERTKKIIGENIRRLRAADKRPVVELAEAIGIPRPYWYELEGGTLNYTVEKLEQIARLFGVTVRDLLTERKGRKGELVGGGRK